MRDPAVTADAGGRPDAVVVARPEAWNPMAAFPIEAAPWTAGTTARIRVQTTEVPQHDGSFGAARLELQTLSDHRALLSQKLEGTWHLLAYVPSTQTFVIGGQFETGAWLPLDEIRYVDEASGEVRMSRYDGGTWIAFAAVPGPDGRFIVFVGESRRDRAFEGGRFRLEVLDTAKDALYDLGRPPAPPPDEDSPFDADEGWDWGAPIDGLEHMDAGIIAFTDGHTLRVSYGADTQKRRARQRRQRSWDLSRAVVAGRMIPSPPAARPVKSMPDEPELKAPVIP